MKRIKAKFASIGGIVIVFFLMPHAVRSQTSAGVSGTVKASADSNLIPGMYTVSASPEGLTSQVAHVMLIAQEEKHADPVAGAQSQQQKTPSSKLPSAPQPNPQTPPAGNANTPSLQDLGFGPNQTQGSAKEQALLNKRTHMLKVHQTLGLITAIPMAAALITGPQAKAKGKHGEPITEPTSANLDFHMALGTLTTGLYFTTAYYAIFAPKIPGVKPKGAIRLHRDLEWVHGPGMIITPILGMMAYKQENAGEKVHGIASAHGAAAFITAAAYGASIVAVSWPIHWKFWER